MKTEINNALKVLQEGGIILYPTDTIWGLGCDATNEKAVDRLCKIKKRADDKSMIVLIDTENRLYQYVDNVPEIAWDLIEVSDTPLTIIYPSAKNLAKNVVAKDNSIGIRVTKNPFCQQLIRRFKKPIVSSSANVTNQKSPANFSEIDAIIKKNVDYIVDLKQNDLTKNQPSSIIKLGIDNQIQIIRK